MVSRDVVTGAVACDDMHVPRPGVRAWDPSRAPVPYAPEADIYRVDVAA